MTILLPDELVLDDLQLLHRFILSMLSLLKVYLYPKIFCLYVKGTQFRSPLHQHSKKKVHQVMK